MVIVLLIDQYSILVSSSIQLVTVESGWVGEVFEMMLP
jgi:hypothetical protein